MVGRLKVREIVEDIAYYMSQWIRFSMIKQSSDKFEVVFGVVQPQFGQVHALFHKRGKNMDSPQHTGDQSTVEAFFSEQIKQKVG